MNYTIIGVRRILLGNLSSVHCTYRKVTFSCNRWSCGANQLTRNVWQWDICTDVNKLNEEEIWSEEDGWKGPKPTMLAGLFESRKMASVQL